jgi:hypothetical protein
MKQSRLSNPRPARIRPRQSALEPPPGVDLDYHDQAVLASVDLAAMREYIERRDIARDYNEISISDQYKVRAEWSHKVTRGRKAPWRGYLRWTVLYAFGC